MLHYTSTRYAMFNDHVDCVNQFNPPCLARVGLTVIPAPRWKRNVYYHHTCNCLCDAWWSRGLRTWLMYSGLYLKTMLNDSWPLILAPWQNELDRISFPVFIFCATYGPLIFASLFLRLKEVSRAKYIVLLLSYSIDVDLTFSNLFFVSWCKRPRLFWSFQ